jgi:hypothetical protein
VKSGDVQDAIHVDSRQLHAILYPIPGQGEKELQAMLNNSAAMKIEQVTKGVKYYNRQIKQEPKTLDRFVEDCKIWQRTIDITRIIVAEIKFVDDLYKLFDEFGMRDGRNVLKNAFIGFKRMRARRLRFGRQISKLS